MRPRIGITTTPSSHISKTLGIQRPIDALDASYADSVEAAGGLPLLLPVVAPALARDVVAGLDGLVLSGGGDVDPGLYGAERAPETDGVDQARDAFEMVLVTEALDLGVPLLCICRGMQVLNVARGGTLVQHLPDAEDRPNMDPATWHTGSHEVAVEGGSLLASVVGDRIGVNSLHHQGVDQLGDGLVVVARDDAGVVEAVEVEDDDTTIGVQWHPEMLLGDEANDKLFAWLVDLAVERPASSRTQVTVGRAAG